MFTTFAGGPPNTFDPGQNGAASRSTSISNHPRSKRSQVARACDSCRVHRSRCDDNQPCSNCQDRGEQCSNEGKAEVRTLPSAIKEIKQLKTQVKELEDELHRRDHSVSHAGACLPKTPTSSALSAASSLRGSDLPREHRSSRKYWEGIHTSTTQSHQTQYYGPASSFYFIGRMSSYLALALQQPHSDHHMQPNSASRAFASPTSSKRGVLERLDVSADGPAVEDSLTGTQEDYFLSLFWQSYHCILQIIDEAEFREHYKSLWVTPETPRRASALVDIVLALCMQYGVASIPRSSAIQKPQVDVDGNDATIAGRWLYRRSQSLLSADLESPSIMTLQCQILAVYYLCNASFQNMAHTTLAVAVRTAQILGIHLEPPKNLPRKERELRKRLWWTLYAVESKTCMKLGRPWSAQLSQTTCSLPAHDHDLALLSGSTFAAFGGKVTWLTYNLQNTTLLLAASAIYIEFYDRCADVLGAIDGATLYSDSDTLESCAQSLVSSMEGLQAWLQDLPDELKTKRKGTGEPFSTDRTPLEMEMFVPLWLQRQRLLLELLYHNLAMNLYRPFISFSTTSSSNSQFTLGNAASCVNHAISITHIMHQVVVDSDLLCGWHEAFQWQWNAALSLIGYILAYPFTSSTSSARKAIDSAIDVFERFGRNFAIAANAANVTRDLTAKADILTHHFGSNMATPASSSSSSTDLRALQTYNGPQLISNEAYSAGLSSQPDTEPTATFSNNSPGMDLAFTIDSFNSFEPMLAGSTNMSNMWNFSQD